MPTVTTSRGTISYSALVIPGWRRAPSPASSRQPPRQQRLRAGVPRVVRRQARHRRRLAGHGNSPMPDTPLGAPGLGDLAVELVDVLDLTNLVVIGNSVGGYAACRIALERPDRVAGVVLVNTGGFTPHTPFSRAFCAVMGTPAAIRTCAPYFARAYMRPTSAADHRHRLACRGPLQDPRGCAYGGGAVEQFHLTRSRLARRRQRHQGSGSDHLGRKGSHRTRPVGQSSREGHPRGELRHTARRARGVLVETRGVAAGSAAVRGVSPTCRSARVPRLTRIPVVRMFGKE